ncbi:MAG TPA: CPBP family intramembrane metalloprotease [bacterium]|nr:CPBP family intramembrane metalloprotease [bacterium]
MKPSVVLCLILLGVLAIGAVLTPLVMIAIGWALHLFPALQKVSSFDIDRVLSRVLLIASFLLLYLFRKQLALKDIFRTAFPRRAGWFSEVMQGAGLGVATLAVLIGITLFTGIRRLEIEPFGMRYGTVVSQALLTAAVVACIEEVFFRGFILKTLMNDIKAVWAVVISAAFYSIVHFTQIGSHPHFAQGDLLSGFKTVGLMLEPLSHPSVYLPEFIGLFAFGIVLAYAYVWTKSLYVSIGIHAGCVFIVKADSLFVAVNQGQRYGFYGTEKMVDGVLSWIILGVLLVALWMLIGRRGAFLPGRAADLSR